MTLRDQSRAQLRALEAQHLRRSPPTLSGTPGPVMRIHDREVIVLCSNDVLGLACDPRMMRTLAECLTHGVGAGASRLVSGSTSAHDSAEYMLAEFSPIELGNALLFSSGYSLNVSVLPALFGPADIILSDALNHASLIDGCRLSRAEVVVYPHGDLRALERSLAAARPDHKNAVIVTESIFSMDGDAADLKRLRQLADRFDAALYVDEAHAIGLLGPEGRGLCAELGVIPDIFVGTLGKAFGSAGGFVAADPDTAELLRNRARGYVFSTAPSPALAAMIAESVEIVRRANTARRRVLGHAARIREALRRLEYNVPEGQAAIVPVLVGDAAKTLALSEALLEQGVFVQAIRPPTVPENTSRLRLVPSAAHSDEQITQAIDAFAAVRKLLG